MIRLAWSIYRHTGHRVGAPGQPILVLAADSAVPNVTRRLYISIREASSESLPINVGKRNSIDLPTVSVHTAPTFRNLIQ